MARKCLSDLVNRLVSFSKDASIRIVVESIALHVRDLIGSSPIHTNRLCEWLVITMKENKLWKLHGFSKERIPNNDDFIAIVQHKA